MPDQRDKLQSIVRMKGPLLPNVVAKDLGTNILFASAMLSELVDSKILRLSALKVGGSPLYFFPNQEHRLQDFAKYLPEKERRAYELLRQQVVLRDAAQEPLMRACLRQIRDFAVPLEVNHGGKQELFWKWYLTPNNQAESLIKKVLGIEEPRPIPTPTAIAVPKEIRHEPRTETKRETQRSLSPKLDEPADKFFRKIKQYFVANNITILEQHIIRKEAELDFLIEVPSAVGTLQYFCKAKSKKKITEGDLSATYVQGQKRHLPVLFLTTGEISKKALQFAMNEFKNMQIKQL
ncbi:MAG TPA: hypothetical protein VJK52_01925 [Candidatus Nanoarchaeia archaeon]|nr:hypothetical protein [Candidatus Nanoarchaeia archaeon]